MTPESNGNTNKTKLRYSFYVGNSFCLPKASRNIIRSVWDFFIFSKQVVTLLVLMGNTFSLLKTNNNTIRSKWERFWFSQSKS